MANHQFRTKRQEWLRRYIPAEIIGTTIALLSAWAIYTQTNSYIAAAAAGWVGEGIGFFGYFIILELSTSHKRHAEHNFWKRIPLTIKSAGTNLIVEFLPAEIIDNLIIRPFALYLAPIYIHPYPVGFLVGKFSADIIFYVMAIAGYEARKRWIDKIR